MSFQMPASSAGSTPYQGASSPCICPYASYDKRIQAIDRAHVDVVALTAIKLLYSGEAETKMLLEICPFSRCKKVNHANPQALVDHIISCRFSSDGETCCAGCSAYKITGCTEKDPAHLGREPAPSERETPSRMDIRNPLRKLSKFFQASLRSSHSSASSSRAGSMTSAESPRSSRDFASPRLEELNPAPLPRQTHLCELTDTPIGELGDTSLPFEIDGVETMPVHHPSELAVQIAEPPRRQLQGHTMDPMQRPGPQRRQRRMSPSPPPLQTNHAILIPHIGNDVHGNWAREGPSSLTNSVFGQDFTESPMDIQPDVSANFGTFRGFTAGAGMGETVSPLGSIDVSPSSSRGHAHESVFTAFEPLTHASFGSAGSSSNVPQQSILGNASMRWELEPSELAAPLPVHGPLRHDSNLSQDSSILNAVPSLYRGQKWNKPQPRTYSGSTSTSTSTMESTGTASATLELLSPSQRIPVASFPNRAQIRRHRSLANHRSSHQLRCDHKGCDYQPTGKVEKNWPSYLRKHQKKHNPEFLPCPRCGNLMTRKDNLKTHLKNSCKGFLHRMVEHSSPDVLDVMSMNDSEAWVDSQLSIPEEEDGLLWPLELHQ